MNLNTASPEQLEAYKAAVAAVLNVDPLMLDYIMMPDPMGFTGTNRVLYAKRGAAEVLRKNMGIDIVSLTPYESNGWLAYTVVAKNREGRQEVAVGAAYTQNLTGERVAHAVMTAQTRAVRRVTLQFVTGGILDESEVQNQAQFNNAPAASSAELTGSAMVVPPPVVPLAKTEYHVPLPAHVGTTAVGILQDAKFEDMKTVSELALTEPSPSEPATSQPEESAAISPSIPPKAKKERKRKPKGFGDPEQTAIPAGVIDAAGVITPAPEPLPVLDLEKMRADAQEQLAAKTAPVPEPKPEPVKEEVPKLTPEQDAEFKAKARLYSNDIFPKGGMTPSPGLGGITMKYRAFAQKYTGATSHVLTAEQYESLFKFLDGFTKQFGERALVEYVNKTLGVTE